TCSSEGNAREGSQRCFGASDSGSAAGDLGQPVKPRRVCGFFGSAEAEAFQSEQIFRVVSGVGLAKIPTLTSQRTRGEGGAPSPFKALLIGPFLAGVGVDTDRFGGCDFDRALELAAGCVNVPTARPANESRNPGSDQDLLKGQHSIARRSAEVNSRPWVQGNQIHLCSNAADQLHQLARILRRVVHLLEQNVFKRETFARP